MRKNERAQKLLDDWCSWSREHRFFGPPTPPSLLAVLAYKNQMTREPPDFPLSAELSALHVALVSLPVEKLQPLIRVYLGFPDRPVKRLAFEAGIDRDTYYNRAHTAADELLRSANHVLNMVRNIGLMKHANPIRADRLIGPRVSGQSDQG